MKNWQPTQAQARAHKEKGYFTVAGVATPDQVAEMRGVIKNVLYTPDPKNVRTDADPMDPMGDTPEARAQRFRKFNRWCHTSPLVWYTAHAGVLAPLARYYLGDDILLKFSSVFVKPAKTGAATPWHQDNGLWRDGETEPFNVWMALDPGAARQRLLAIHSGQPQNRDRRTCALCRQHPRRAAAGAGRGPKGRARRRAHRVDTRRCRLLAQQPVALQPGQQESAKPDRHRRRLYHAGSG